MGENCRRVLQVRYRFASVDIVICRTSSFFFFSITSMERAALKLKSKYETMKKRKQLDIKVEDDITEENKKSREQFMQKLEDELEKSKKDFELRPATIAYVDQKKKSNESQGAEKTEDKLLKKEIVVRSLSTLLDPNPKVIEIPKAIVEREKSLDVKPQPTLIENSRKRRKLNTPSELKFPQEELLEVHLDLIEDPVNAKLKVVPLTTLQEYSTSLETDTQATDADANETNFVSNEPIVKTEICNLLTVSKTEVESSNEETVQSKCESSQADMLEVCRLKMGLLQQQIIIL